MSTDNKILLPTDFSDNAWKALSFAANLQDHLDGMELVILHSFLPFYTGFQSAQENQAQYDSGFEISQKRMDSLENQIKREFPFLNYQLLIKDGTLYNSIQETREELPIKAIVMGSKGSTGLQANLIGSQTFEVGKRVDLPLMIIPGKYEFKPNQEAVFLTNFERNDGEALEIMKDLIHPHLIHFVHFAETSTSEILSEKLEHHVQNLNLEGIEYKTSILPISDFEDSQKIKEMIRTLNWSLIALNPVERGFFENLFTKSFTRPLIHSSEVPILLAKS